jgi:hypothetical protein
MINLLSDPTVIGVFGSENCPWSKQLKEEVWSSSTFQASLHSAKIEMREEVWSEPETPVFVLMDNGKEIGRLGFLMIPAEKYVSLLKEMVAIHEMCKNLSELNSNQLLQFYRKCRLLNMETCAAQILEQGLAIDTGTDFLIENYAKVIKDHPRRAQKIKTEIRKRAPESPTVEWELALLTFQAKNENGASPLTSAIPLEKYLRRYGDQDLENRWRCHLVLAEFFSEKNIQDKAQQHYAAAYKFAPDDMKELIPHD